MKADEPRAPIVKFGMSTDESERMVQRHFEVLDEEQLIAGGALAHNLRVADIVHAKNNSARQPMPVPNVSPVPVASVVKSASATLHDLRARLGLN